MVVLILLLLILGIYILFSPGVRQDFLTKMGGEDEKWQGEDLQPKYQDGVPYTPTLDKPFNDPEVPNRPVKKKTNPRTKTKKRRKKVKK